MKVNKSSILRKVLAVSLAAAMMTGTGFTTAGYYIGTSGVSVSAADLTYGDFKYWVQSDNTIRGEIYRKPHNSRQNRWKNCIKNRILVIGKRLPHWKYNDSCRYNRNLLSVQKMF